MNHLKFRIIVPIAVILIALFVGNQVISIFYPAPDGNYLFPPHKLEKVYADNSRFPGITQESKVKINSLGLRCDEVPSGVELKVAAIGGSTTECLLVNQPQIWTYKLQQMLNTKTKKEVWVANMGKSGLHSAHHILQVEHLDAIEEFRDIETVIVLAGINELNSFLINPDNYLNPNKEKLFEKLFTYCSNSNRPLYKRNGFWRVMENIWRKYYLLRNFDTKREKNIIKWRKKRSRSTEINQPIPNLDTALNVYGERLVQLINTVNSQNRKLVFLTQPVMWRANMDNYHQSLLWMGGIGYYQQELTGTTTYHSPETLRRGMDLFNQRLIDIAHQFEIPLVNLAEIVPPDTTAFYDDCHFNENGCSLVAELVCEKMLQLNIEN